MRPSNSVQFAIFKISSQMLWLLIFFYYLLAKFCSMACAHLLTNKSERVRAGSAVNHFTPVGEPELIYDNTYSNWAIFSNFCSIVM